MPRRLQVLFISTWPAESGLSSATVHPHVRILAADDRVSGVHYVSMESEESPSLVEIDGVIHEPIVDRQIQGMLGKALIHSRRIASLMSIADRVRPDLVICRGSPAGVFGAKLHNKFGISYCVESFEPHADYMRTAGVWSKYDPRYIVQRRWERESKRLADKLITVSYSYASHLVAEEGLPSSDVLTVPCWVDETKFLFSSDRRQSVRENLGLQSAVVCIYVGKFGGLYYERTAFNALELISEQIGERFFLLILSPDSEERIAELLESSTLDRKRVWVGSVPHDEVPGYLSAADFAVSFHRSADWSFAFSPIKHAEYWACGLPVLFPCGVGDESNWADAEGLGATFNISDPGEIRLAVERLKKIIGEPSHRSRIRSLGLEKRGRGPLEQSYSAILDSRS